MFTEIDECSSMNPCDVTHSTCVNKDKFFECQCTEPWIPDVDGLGCSGKSSQTFILFLHKESVRERE